MLTLVAFEPSLHARFVSDDVNAIVENEWVSGVLDPVGIASNFSWWGRGRSDSAGFRPAATLSFALSRRATGDGPEGYRLVNFAMNAIVAGLLFALARALALSIAASGAAAMLFAVLPIHSEAVIWIVGRAELGAAAGFLAATLACLHHRGSASLVALGIGALSVAIGMAFKENTVTVLAAPLIFFVLLGREVPGWRRHATMLAALIVGAAACLLLRAAASGASAASDGASLLDNPLSVVDPVTRLLGAFAVLGRYVALTLWPASLSVDYSWNALGIGPGFVASADSAVAAMFLAAAGWAAWRGPGRRDVVAIGLLLAAVSYSIVSNTVFVIGTILGERLFYLPSAGLCLAAAAMAEPVFDRAQRHDGSAMPASGGLSMLRVTMLRVTVLIVALLIVASIAVDRQRSTDWLTPVSLFEAAVAKVPRSARARMELASAYGNAGRTDEAEVHFRAALEIKPDYAAAAYNEGNTLAHASRFEEAAAAYRRALAIDPGFARAWHNLALTEKIRGNSDAWVEALEGAAAASPASPSLQNEIGEAMLAAGRYGNAIQVYDRLVASGGAVAATYFNRGVARHHQGGCAAAVEDYRLATNAAQPPREAFVSAAGCLRELGRVAQAEAIEKAAQVANRETRR